MEKSLDGGATAASNAKRLSKWKSGTCDATCLAKIRDLPKHPVCSKT